MIRGQSLISVFFVTAFAALQVGCAADAGTDDGSERTEDSLVDSPADDAAPTDGSETTGGTKESALRQLGNARTVAAKDQRSWGAGEPHPIPWHEAKTSAVNAEADDTGDLGLDVPGDDTPDQAPTPPAAAHR